VLGLFSLEKRESYPCVHIPDGGSKDDRATVKGLEQWPQTEISILEETENQMDTILSNLP